MMIKCKIACVCMFPLITFVYSHWLAHSGKFCVVYSCGCIKKSIIVVCDFTFPNSWIFPDFICCFFILFSFFADFRYWSCVSN